LTVSINPSALNRTRWYEFAIRFLTGGLTTALIGVIAKEFGPNVGGLFLAFPSVFIGAVTLVDSHQRKKKQRIGLKGERRGREAAALDAAGAAIGSLGLLAFAIVAWRLLPDQNGWEVLTFAIVAWLAVSGSLWWIRKRCS
jgi:hypothetical protein